MLIFTMAVVGFTNIIHSIVIVFLINLNKTLTITHEDDDCSSVLVALAFLKSFSFYS